MSALSHQAELALCAYLTQSLLNEQADRYAELQHLSSRPTHINPCQSPYRPLNFDTTANIPTLPDWVDALDDFDRFDFL